MLETIKNTADAFSSVRIGPWFALGDTLLVGEGNLSFARSLLRLPWAQIRCIIATTFNSESELTLEAKNNTYALKRRGVLVLHNIDATRLEQTFQSNRFDSIIFQFPNVGSRESKHGHNPNHVLLRNFLRSAKSFLNPTGRILVSIVDSPYYQGLFQPEEAAKFASYETPEYYPFDPSMFPGYHHLNTNDEDSAIDNYSRFATWVFRPKQ